MITGPLLCSKVLLRGINYAQKIYAVLLKKSIMHTLTKVKLVWSMAYRTHQQIKWAGNGDGSNVRLRVRWTRESLDYAQGVLSNRNYTI